MNDPKLKIIGQHDAVLKSWERFERNRSAEWGLAGHDTGHDALNLSIGGWIPTKLTTIAARSGVGKTAMTTQMFQAGKRILQGRRAEFLFFTWEMSPDFLVDRHICHQNGLTLKHLTQGARLLPDHRIQSIKEAYQDADSLPVHYQQISLNIKDVMAMSQKFVDTCNRKSDVEGILVQPVVVVDFIGMAKYDDYGPRTYGISEFIYGCKQVANQTGASFCVFSQINRGADQKERPQKVDISDSQSIEQASDNLIILHRPEYHRVPVIKMPRTGEEVPSDGKMLIFVEKSRDYGPQDILTNCDVRYYRFWNEGVRWSEPYWEKYSQADFWINHFDLNDGSQLKVV